MVIATAVVLMAQNMPVMAVQAPARPSASVSIATVSVEVKIAPTSAPVRAPRAAQTSPAQGGGRCGGDLPSCSIVQCESKGNIRARNAHSSAAGKYQITSGTWNGYGGYSSADQAPEEVQDAKARELWAGGAGAGHWRQCL